MGRFRKPLRPASAGHLPFQGRQSVSQDIGAHSTLHRGAQGVQPQAQGAFPSRDQDDGRGGTILEFIDLVAQLSGEIFLDVEDGVVVMLPGEGAEDPPGLLGARGGIGLQPQGLEAHHGLPTADSRDLKHTNHAAFPGWSPARRR